MKADLRAKEQPCTASQQHERTHSQRLTKLVECPFEVRIDGVLHDRFYDIRDALASARAAKSKECSAVVVVTDARTGKLVIEVKS